MLLNIVLYSIAGLIACIGGVLRSEPTMAFIGIVIIGISDILKKMNELKR